MYDRRQNPTVCNDDSYILTGLREAIKRPLLETIAAKVMIFICAWVIFGSMVEPLLLIFRWTHGLFKTLL